MYVVCSYYSINSAAMWPRTLSPNICKVNFGVVMAETITIVNNVAFLMYFPRRELMHKVIFFYAIIIALRAKM